MRGTAAPAQRVPPAEATARATTRRPSRVRSGAARSSGAWVARFRSVVVGQWRSGNRRQQRGEVKSDFASEPARERGWGTGRPAALLWRGDVE
nr:unnamed protein product [Digitaria exilis]